MFAKPYNIIYNVPSIMYHTVLLSHEKKAKQVNTAQKFNFYCEPLIKHYDVVNKT